MRPAFRRFVSAAQAFALTSALTACVLTGGDNLVVPGGAEDFPNTVTPLGRIAVTDLSSVGEWEQVPLVTPTLPELPSLDSLLVSPPGAKVAVLGKAGAAVRVQNGIDTLAMHLWVVDTTRILEAYLMGRIYAYAADSSDTFAQYDTVSALYLGDRSNTSLAAARDSIVANPGKFLMPLDFRGTVVRGPAGNREAWVRQSYHLRNVDMSGTIDLAEYRTITPLPNGHTMTKWVKIYGPDGAYADPQAVPEEFELLERGPNGDTISWTSVKDADWDRKLWASEGHGVVDVAMRLRNPEAHPIVTRLHSQLRAGYHVVPGGRDSLSQLSFQEQRWLRSGRNVTFTFRGQGTTDNLLVAADTARITVDTVYVLRDSLIKYSAAYKMLLGPVIDRMADHRLVAYSVSKHWRLGALSSNTSVFIPDSPLPMGQSGFTGRMSTTSIYANGDTTVTEGSINETTFNLVVRNVKKNVVSAYEVVLDKAGELVSYTPIALPDATTAVPRRGIAP